MNPLTRSSLEAYASAPRDNAAEWIRVQLDTGGIAAGAEAVLAELVRVRDERGLTIPVRRVGSVGYSFADPVVEVKSGNLPRILYGRVSPEIAAQIVREHVIGRRLFDDHIIATRSRGTQLDAPVSHILVRDTGPDATSKTEYFQFSLIEELKRRGLANRTQVVRALDLGLDLVWSWSG